MKQETHSKWFRWPQHFLLANLQQFWRGYPLTNRTVLSLKGCGDKTTPKSNVTLTQRQTYSSKLGYSSHAFKCRRELCCSVCLSICRQSEICCFLCLVLCLLIGVSKTVDCYSISPLLRKALRASTSVELS